MTTQLDRRNRLRSLEDDVRSYYAEAARSLWQVGQALLVVREEALWRDDDHATFDAWLNSDRLPLSRASGYKAMRIAEHFSGDMAERFGTEKLVAAVSYLRATKVEEKPGDLMALNVRVRQDDGAWGAIPFTKASAAQIREATQLLSTNRRGRRVPAEMGDKVSKLNKVLAKSDAGLRSARVSVKRSRDGRLMLAMRAVPVDDLEAFLSAIRAAFVEG